MLARMYGENSAFFQTQFATPLSNGSDDIPGASEGLLAWLRSEFGGWPGAKVAEGQPIASEVEREKVRSGPQNIVIPWFLPYFDTEQTLHETATMRAAYRRMLADPNVKAALMGKILAVAALDLKVIPHDKKDDKANEDAELVRWNLEDALEGGVPGLIWSVLSGALIDGYSVCEKVWDREPAGKFRGAYYLRAVKPKDTGKDIILETDQYRNVVSIRGLRYNPGDRFSPANFVIYRHLPLWDTATGQSDLRAVYSRWWMLDTVLKLRAVAAEKRALPVIVGHYTTPQDRPPLEDALALVRSQNWLAVPETVRLQALEIAGGAEATFSEFARDCKHDIFLGIAGAMLQSIEGSVPGGRGDTKEHRDTADLFVWHLSVAVEQLLNDRRKGVVKDIVDLNRAAPAYPKVRLASVSIEQMRQEMEIRKIAYEIGLPQSRGSIYEGGVIEAPDPNDRSDSLGGKVDQDAQLAASTLMVPSPQSPGVRGAADQVVRDDVQHQQGDMAGSLPGEQMVEGAECAEGPGSRQPRLGHLPAVPGMTDDDIVQADANGRLYGKGEGGADRVISQQEYDQQAGPATPDDEDMAERPRRVWKAGGGKWAEVVEDRSHAEGPGNRTEGQAAAAVSRVSQRDAGGRPGGEYVEVGAFAPGRRRPRRMAEPGERDFGKAQTGEQAASYQRDADRQAAAAASSAPTPEAFVPDVPQQQPAAARRPIQEGQPSYAPGAPNWSDEDRFGPGRTHLGDDPFDTPTEGRIAFLSHAPTAKDYDWDRDAIIESLFQRHLESLTDEAYTDWSNNLPEDAADNAGYDFDDWWDQNWEPYAQAARDAAESDHDNIDYEYAKDVFERLPVYYLNRDPDFTAIYAALQNNPHRHEHQLAMNDWLEENRLDRFKFYFDDDEDHPRARPFREGQGRVEKFDMRKVGQPAAAPAGSVVRTVGEHDRYAPRTTPEEIQAQMDAPPSGNYNPNWRDHPRYRQMVRDHETEQRRLEASHQMHLRKRRAGLPPSESEIQRRLQVAQQDTRQERPAAKVMAEPGERNFGRAQTQGQGQRYQQQADREQASQASRRASGAQDAAPNPYPAQPPARPQAPRRKGSRPLVPDELHSILMQAVREPHPGGQRHPHDDWHQESGDAEALTDWYQDNGVPEWYDQGLAHYAGLLPSAHPQDRPHLASSHANHVLRAELWRLLDEASPVRATPEQEEDGLDHFDLLQRLAQQRGYGVELDPDDPEERRLGHLLQWGMDQHSDSPMLYRWKQKQSGSQMRERPTSTGVKADSLGRRQTYMGGHHVSTPPRRPQPRSMVAPAARVPGKRRFDEESDDGIPTTPEPRIPLHGDRVITPSGKRGRVGRVRADVDTGETTAEVTRPGGHISAHHGRNLRDEKNHQTYDYDEAEQPQPQPGVAPAQRPPLRQEQPPQRQASTQPTQKAPVPDPASIPRRQPGELAPAPKPGGQPAQGQPPQPLRGSQDPEAQVADSPPVQKTDWDGTIIGNKAEQTVKAHAERHLGSLTPQDAHELLGFSAAMPDARAELKPLGRYTQLYSDDVPMQAYGRRVVFSHPDVTECSRFVGVDDEGKRFIRNEVIRLKQQGGGVGSALFRTQVANAARAGFDYIQTHAAGDWEASMEPGGMNGYYTWAAMGYDQSIDTLERYNRPLAKAIRATFPGAKGVQDIMEAGELPIHEPTFMRRRRVGFLSGQDANEIRRRCAETDRKLGREPRNRDIITGQDWWLAFGGDLHEARFDLTEGSRSQQLLQARNRKKGRF